MSEENLNQFEVISAGRAGLRLGQVSELTIIIPLKPGGADNLRKKLRENPNQAEVMARIGTVHDMRWVIFDEDKRLLFATAYDGDWDGYIDDFGTQIPKVLDYFFMETEGYPGINSPTIKDFIASHQITSSGWYCAYPENTVKDIWKAGRIVKAFNNLLDEAQK
ncbi:hypothetical protein ACWGJ1_27305 [Bacillus wiedmannii]|uniref:hypothetical protein n=1 Tax=Bacillus wiedmannii TaxID=1890302 RepID=UPI0035E33C33